MLYKHLPENMSGRSGRDAISISRLFEMFPDEAAAEAWFEKKGGPDGECFCPRRGSVDARRAKSRNGSSRCRTRRR